MNCVDCTVENCINCVTVVVSVPVVDGLLQWTCQPVDAQLAS